MGLLAAFPASAADPIKIGLVTALSGQSARAGPLHRRAPVWQDIVKDTQGAR